MAKNKTAETTASVTSFIEKTGDPIKREDSYKIAALIKNQTGFEPKMWGSSIIGFGSYHYKYDSGHEGNAPLIGFSPRNNALTLYMASNFEGKEQLLRQLGKHRTGVGCIYIKRLDDVNIDILKKMVDRSVAHLQNRYPNPG